MLHVGKSPLIGLFALCAVAAWAQITITVDNFGSPTGGTVEHAEVDTTTPGAGPAGANQVWTMPEFEWETYNQWEGVLPSTTPFAADFPTATMAIHGFRVMDEGGTVEFWQFCRVAEDGFYMQGMGFMVNGTPVAQPLETEELWLPLPLTYGDSWTTVTLTTEGPGISTWDSTRHVIDGWGTMQTPYGSCPVLRKFSETWRRRTEPGGTNDSEDANYCWINQQGTPVVEYESNEETRNPDFTRACVRITGWPLTADPRPGPVARRFTIEPNYPNPFNPETMLPVTLARAGRVTLDVYDAVGRQVRNGVYDLPAGRHALLIQGMDWSSGAYFARLRFGSETRTTKLMLLK